MADQDQIEPDEPAPERIEGSGAGPTGWNQWVRRNFSMQRFLRPAPARPRSGSSSEPDQSDLTPAQRSAAARAAVNNLNPRERQIGFIALAFELALTAVVVIPYLTHNIKLSKNNLKTMSAVHFFLVEGLVVAIFLLLGTLLKRRALLGFAALATAIWLIELPALRVFGPCLSRPRDVAAHEGAPVPAEHRLGAAPVGPRVSRGAPSAPVRRPKRWQTVRRRNRTSGTRRPSPHGGPRRKSRSG